MSRWPEQRDGYMSHLWRQTHWEKDLWWTICPALQGQVEAERGGCGVWAWVEEGKDWWQWWGNAISGAFDSIALHAKHVFHSASFSLRLLKHTHTFWTREHPLTSVHMNALIDASGINIHQYNAIGLKCLDRFPLRIGPRHTHTHVHTQKHTCMHMHADTQLHLLSLAH